MVYSITWDETKPDDNNYGYEIDNYIRNVLTAIRERLATEHTDLTGTGGLATMMHEWVVAAKSTGSPYTALITDHVLLITTGATDYTINLFTAVGNSGKILKIKKVDAGAGTVIIDGDTTETIDGELTFVLPRQYNFVYLISDGANWHIIAMDAKFLDWDVVWSDAVHSHLTDEEGGLINIYRNIQSYNMKFGGDGSDGDVTISLDTTLTDSTIGVKVMQYNNLTIEDGRFLQAHANDKVLVVLVKGTLTLGAGSVIKMNGRGGAGGAAADAGGGAGAFGGGSGGGRNAGGEVSGGGGGGGQAGNAGGEGDGLGGATIPAQYLNPWNAGGHCKGKGGTGTGEAAIGEAGAKYVNTPLSPLTFEFMRYLWGGGGGGGAYVAGAGGAGGGIIWIETNAIVWGAGAIISANGVAGATGGNYGGGGGGGAGGSIQLIYITKTGSSTIQVTAGAGGAAGPNGGWAGGAGIAGISGEFQTE